MGNIGMSEAKDRVCEMAAEAGDVGFAGCQPQTKYVVPVYPGKRAVVNPPIGGYRAKGWEPAQGPNTTPQAGRGGEVYIPFAYAQQPHRHHTARFAQIREDPSKADEEEAAYQVVYAAEQARMKKAEEDMAAVVEDEEETKALRDSNFRKFTSEEMQKLITKGLNVVGGGK